MTGGRGVPSVRLVRESVYLRRTSETEVLFARLRPLVTDSLADGRTDPEGWGLSSLE